MSAEGTSTERAGGTASGAAPGDPGGLVELFDATVDEVHRYLRARCGSRELAEDLTASTYARAALAATRPDPPELTIGWLIVVARNLLVDHWRRDAVAERSLAVVAGGEPDGHDPWDGVLDRARARAVLASLPGDQRAALVLRHVDDLDVASCAEALGRGVRSTERLLARAGRAFRAAYETTGGDDDG